MNFVFSIYWEKIIPTDSVFGGVAPLAQPPAMCFPDFFENPPPHPGVGNSPILGKSRTSPEKVAI